MTALTAILFSASSLTAAEPLPSKGLRDPADPKAGRAALVPPSLDTTGSSLGAMPSSFVENRGQEDPRVAFLWRNARASIYFTSGGVTWAMEDGQRRWAVKTRFIDAQRVQPTGVRVEPTVVSYFKGSPDEWITAVPTYSQIVYRQLWPGIDLAYFAEAGGLKYELRLAPGADPAAIRVDYAGATSLGLNEKGGLEVGTPAGGFVDEAPISYQRIGGRRVGVPSNYEVEGTSLGFGVGRYDPERPLVIDPVVVLRSGYIGGSGFDQAHGIAVDSVGSAYISGLTDSTEASFPVAAGPDLTYNDAGDGDAFVAKLNTSGSLDYLGYIGGSAWDIGWDIAVDASGAAYVTGAAESTEQSFPVLGGPDLTFNGGGVDVFVAKVSPSGTILDYSGYVGGSGAEGGYGVAVDGSGGAYIVGETDSTESTFPVRNGPDLTYNDQVDAFIAKLSPSGSELSYAGYVGGSEWEFANSVALDDLGNAYIAGMANSTEATFPVAVGPDLIHNGGQDAFVAKVVPDGTGLTYSGYIGGSASEVAWGIAVDDAGSAYVTGDTESSEATFPVKNGPDLSHNGASDAFVAKVADSGTSLTYAGYVGGSEEDSSGLGSIAVDGMGSAYLTGVTRSTESTFPVTVGPDLTQNGATDAYVGKLEPSGRGFQYAGFLGGSEYDVGYGIAVDSSRVAHVAGGTGSTEETFPVKGGPDSTFNDTGIGDAFVAQVGIVHALTVTKAGSGFGAVASSPAGISCGTDCSEEYLEGSSVTLTATASADSRFGGWSGACTGTSATCEVSMESPKTVTARFIETIPPETTITSGPAPRTRSAVQFSFTSNETGSTFECSLDGASFEACSSPKPYSGLIEGDHDFRVRATDPSGNTDPTPAVWSWTVDLTPPETTITSGPSGVHTSDEASFTFESSESPPIFGCALDSDAFSRCTSPTTYLFLQDGTHTFRVRAEDQAGNVDPTPATRTWVVDARGPVMAFQRPTGGVYVNDQQFGGQGPIFVVGYVTVEVRANDAESGVAAFEFAVDGVPVDPSQVTQENDLYRFRFAPASAGQYTITARSTNGSGISSTLSIPVFGTPS